MARCFGRPLEEHRNPWGARYFFGDQGQMSEHSADSDVFALLPWAAVRSSKLALQLRFSSAHRQGYGSNLFEQVHAMSWQQNYEYHLSGQVPNLSADAC